MKTLPNARFENIFTVEPENVILDTIKLAEPSLDGTYPNKDKTFIFRVYESKGGRCVFKLGSSLPIKNAFYTNILEDDLGEPVEREHDVGPLLVPILPFQVITLKITFA